MKFHTPSVMAKGFRCASMNCGIKEEGKDLSLFLSDVTANAAGVFTRNLFPGAPVVLGREIIRHGQLRAVVVNSRVSNVGTGEEGIENARRMARSVSQAFDIPEQEVIMSSTGVIGRQLPIEKIEAGISAIGSGLTSDPLVGAEGIMTTDTYPKAISLEVDGATLTIIGKGSGMIEPNMATMLVYILTDAEIPVAALDRMLREAVKDSFNMLSVDSDTSTSDTCLALANGLAGPVDHTRFAEALKTACVEMTRLLARDGEGATKLLTATVTGAVNDTEARFIAKALINSPLIKTMAYGADPNIGRILMAVGKCTHCTVAPEKLSITINGTLVYTDQARVDFDEARVRSLLSGEHVAIGVSLSSGDASATAYGCDLTEKYIEENAAYYSS
ncbi:bifunctional glutamate N-acetyltransferase/amino-acid acetyltransferase ArgJ [Desulfoluna spongiiphila]|uniref:bifunctional glutamate N-acetyltransferase/amino-acid acetyltransferase ArgJ n=1 Tax=Desulfoluna spongiiphila TaxID=419481 RepID=UPI00125B4993|nr:bifunctional glutamate N-acetyltransferase/amino-acid acetyltransferase ArgJ [Desulfoluna spongiiphila]VVS91005.1 arginine biosynthesis protein argj [Desulfoluna spongiiphila]